MLPALVLLLAVLLAAASVGIAQLRCVDAAREGARAASRGDADAAVHDLVRRVAPPGAEVNVARAGDIVTVAVTADPGLPVIGGMRLPAVSVRSSAVAAREPGGVAP